MATLAPVDLSDVDIFMDGRSTAVFRELREHRPVYRNVTPDGTAFWALTRYDDVLWAYRNHRVLSSRNGAILGGSFRSDSDSASGKMLVASDLPRHRLLKAVVQPALSSAVVERIGRQVGTLVERAIQRLLSEGGGDFATDVAAELPAGALMVIFGVSHAEAHELIELTHRIVGVRDELFFTADTPAALRLAWAHAQVFDVLAELVERRRRAPGDDYVSALLAARVNGRPLSEEEVIYQGLNMAVGGNETSAYTATAGLRALMEHPASYERLLAEPALLPTAYAEMLRWGTANAYVLRMSTEDIMVRETLIPAGSPITLWNASADRDERQFDAPDEFRVDRNPNRHLAYGAGLHRCIGAPVAYMELSTLFTALLASGVRLAAAGPVRRMRSNFIQGFVRMPVTVVRP
jgi:cytochrome P450